VVGSSKVPALEHQVGQARRRGALQGERVVLVELGDARGWHQGQLAALGGGGVNPLEMIEAGRVLDVAELGVGVGGPGRSRHEQNRQTASKAS
jgi:hypothetical protein